MPSLLMVYLWLCARRATTLCDLAHPLFSPACTIRTTKGFRAAGTPRAIHAGPSKRMAKWQGLLRARGEVP